MQMLPPLSYICVCVSNILTFSAKLAAMHIKRRMETKEPKVILLSLELLDLAMQKCGNPLHIQVGNKDFMNVMVLLLNQKNQPPQVIAIFHIA
jgi:hypothetical protein